MLQTHKVNPFEFSLNNSRVLIPKNSVSPQQVQFNLLHVS